MKRTYHLDICYILDATDSMKPYIDLVREKTIEIVE